MPPGSRAESEELNMKQIKVEWCENFIKATFKKHVPDGGGTYGTPMSEALEKLTKVETVHDSEGNFLYNVFKLA